jgi:hypothetical protein
LRARTFVKQPKLQHSGYALKVQTGRSLLKALVARILKEELEQRSTTGLVKELALLRQTLTMLQSRLEERIQTLDRSPITASSTVHAAWRRHPETARIFARYGLPACLSCRVGADETLEEAAANERLPLAEILSAINRAAGG